LIKRQKDISKYLIQVNFGQKYEKWMLVNMVFVLIAYNSTNTIFLTTYVLYFIRKSKLYL